MSETAAASKDVASPRPGAPAPRRDFWGQVQRALIIFGQQREAAVFVVAVLLFAYFWLTNDNFFTKLDLINLSQVAAPIIIIAIGEVFLLICGEIDLSVGFIFTLRPVRHALPDRLLRRPGRPGDPALPAHGPGCRLGPTGSSRSRWACPRSSPRSAPGSSCWGSCWSPRTRTRRPSRASAAGHRALDRHLRLGRDHLGDRPGRDLPDRAQPDPVGPAHRRGRAATSSAPARPASSVARIKYGNFMITGFMGALVGIQVRFQTNAIDPSSGRLPADVLRRSRRRSSAAPRCSAGPARSSARSSARWCSPILIDGFNLVGISANPLPIIFGGAILVAMIANVQLARLRASREGAMSRRPDGTEPAVAAPDGSGPADRATCCGSSTSPSGSAR